MRLALGVCLCALNAKLLRETGSLTLSKAQALGQRIALRVGARQLGQQLLDAVCAHLLASAQRRGELCALVNTVRNAADTKSFSARARRSRSDKPSARCSTSAKCARNCSCKRACCVSARCRGVLSASVD